MGSAIACKSTVHQRTVCAIKYTSAVHQRTVPQETTMPKMGTVLYYVYKKEIHKNPPIRVTLDIHSIIEFM